MYYCPDHKSDWKVYFSLYQTRDLKVGIPILFTKHVIFKYIFSLTETWLKAHSSHQTRVELEGEGRRAEVVAVLVGPHVVNRLNVTLEHALLNNKKGLQHGLLGWKFMSCSHCQELCQQASWLLIGCTRANNQSDAWSENWPNSCQWLQLTSFHSWSRNKLTG